MILPQVDSGSFRDPGGNVFVSDNKVYRTVCESKAHIYNRGKAAGIYQELEDKKLLLSLKECDISEFSNLDKNVRYVLEHPMIPFISYPYEWCFSSHKQAALLHLDLQLAALKSDFSLCDATAYNVQFQGTKPVFIDHLSLEPYQENEIWIGHRQFCMQFLNPLLLWSKMGISPNSWFRGNLEGIPVEDLAHILPWRKKISWTVFSHVALQAMLQKNSLKGDKLDSLAKSAKLSKKSFEGILLGLRSYIQNLKGPHTDTVWANYENCNTYSDNDAKIKADFIQKMVRAVKPKLLYDIGCNTGMYSEVALDAGAGYVVGFDFDYATLDFAYDRFRKNEKNFLAIQLDATNPSPSQGWGQAERKGLMERAQADALIALAVIHHIVIARNVPMSMALDWFIKMAPIGVIEFPNKEDPMVQQLLRLRKDVFPNYHEKAFLSELQKRAKIVSSQHITENGRLLVWYDATSP